MNPDTPSPSGQQGPPPRRSEERRVVTTLFCDLVGFTSLSECNDPELVDGFLRRYYSVARKAIEAYGGTVEKFIGDAVVAAFGAPTMHEDDPERAVRAGLRLVDEVDALPGIGGQAVEVRVGINTGESLVRLDIDPASGEGFLIGDAVNVAARLQSAAPPMAVAVGEATHTATARVFAFEACHPVTLKGKAKPLAAWIATAPLARTGSELRSFASAFVGREEELFNLQALLEEAVENRAPRFALILGEPGIGKSRLLAEFARRLDDQPITATWRQGRCLPFGSGVTFWALSEIIRDCAGILESDGVARSEARLETVLPEGPDRERLRARLCPLLGLEAEEASREENFAAWRLFLENLASSDPTVLVVEDLHWADEAMLAFMDYLAQNEAAVPLLVLCSARPEVTEFSGPGAAFVAAATHLPVGPLSGEETGQLVVGCLGAKSLPAKLQAKLLEASGGNPLFAEELVRLLQDRDLLVTHGGQTQLREGAELPLPDSIGALIAARLDLVSPAHKGFLADAAVVGRTFWAGAVAAVGGDEVARVYDGLMELVAKELVRPERSSSIEGETEFAFVHALVCDVAYSQLTRADRAVKHARLAKWLEERATGRTEDLAEVLAFHYGIALEMASAAGLFELEDELAEPTTRYLELAGGRAAPLDATAAAAHFARAERVADEASRPKRRFFLSRRTRRTLQRRAPLLAASAAVIILAIAAAFLVYEFRSQHKAAGPVRLTAAQIQDRYSPGVVLITAEVPVPVNGKLTWKKVQGSGFVISKNGLILTSSALVDDTYGPMVRTFAYFEPQWVTCEFWGANGQYTRVRGFVCYQDPMAIGYALIAVDPHKVHLVPIPVGDATTARVGEPVVLLSFFGTTGFPSVMNTALRLTAVWHDELPNSSGAKTVTAMCTNSQLDPYSYGGPLIDTSGKVIGVEGPMPYINFNDETGDHPSSVAGSAMAVTYLRMTETTMSQNNGRHKAWLDLWGDGVWFRENAKALGLPVSDGMVVEWVDPGGPAAKAGIRGGTRVEIFPSHNYGRWEYLAGGDVIVAVDGKPVHSSDDLTFDNRKPGDVVTLKLYRGRRLLTIKARLTAYPYTPASA